MLVKYADDTNEIKLIGDTKELVSFSKKLLLDNIVIELISEGVNPSPYSRLLENIAIRNTSINLVNISVLDNTLCIEGSYDKLLIFSDNVLSFGKDWKKDEHIHIEYFDSHFYLSPNSAPLVITHS